MKQISRSNIPLVHKVIPIFDIITVALNEFIDNTTLPAIVWHAALRGMIMLNKYYALTDDSIIYQLSMSVSFNLDID